MFPHDFGIPIDTLLSVHLQFHLVCTHVNQVHLLLHLDVVVPFTKEILNCLRLICKSVE